jgi:hypothetical protein
MGGNHINLAVDDFEAVVTELRPKGVERDQSAWWAPGFPFCSDRELSHSHTNGK